MVQGTKSKVMCPAITKERGPSRAIMLRSSGGLIFSRNSKKSLLHAKDRGEKSSFPEDYLVEYNLTYAQTWSTTAGR
jgi:hypothetical protein